MRCYLFVKKFATLTGTYVFSRSSSHSDHLSVMSRVNIHPITKSGFKFIKNNESSCAHVGHAYNNFYFQNQKRIDFVLIPTKTTRILNYSYNLWMTLQCLLTYSILQYYGTLKFSIPLAKLVVGVKDIR